MSFMCSSNLYGFHSTEVVGPPEEGCRERHRFERGCWANYAAWSYIPGGSMIRLSDSNNPVSRSPETFAGYLRNHQWQGTRHSRWQRGLKWGLLIGRGAIPRPRNEGYGALTVTNRIPDREPAMSVGLQNLKHIVVLMLENRSFDHMLGSLKVVDSRMTELRIKSSDPDTTGRPSSRNNRRSLGDINPDPDHHFPAVDLQIFGGDMSVARAPNMGGVCEKLFRINVATSASRRKSGTLTRWLPVLTTLPCLPKDSLERDIAELLTRPWEGRATNQWSGTNAFSTKRPVGRQHDE